MKKRILFGIAFILIFMLSSCLFGASEEGVLPVVSLDYEGLTELHEGPIDEKVLEHWGNSSNPYWDYACYISVKQGKLSVSSSQEDEFSHTMMGNYGYFVGMDMGEFDGWVKYYPYGSGMNPDAEPRLVVAENCRGFVQKDNNNGYLLTGIRHMATDEGALYKLSLPLGDSQWEWVKVLDFSGMPVVYCYQEASQILYVATAEELLAVSLDDHSVSVLADLSPWDGAGYATSMVELDGRLYLGMRMGIYEYDLRTRETAWYPMNYEKYVKPQESTVGSIG